MIGVGDLVTTTVKKGRKTIGLVVEVSKHSNVWSRKDGRCKPSATVLAYNGREHTFLLDDLEIAEKINLFLDKRNQTSYITNIINKEDL